MTTPNLYSLSNSRRGRELCYREGKVFSLLSTCYNTTQSVLSHNILILNRHKDTQNADLKIYINAYREIKIYFLNKESTGRWSRLELFLFKSLKMIFKCLCLKKTILIQRALEQKKVYKMKSLINYTNKKKQTNIDFMSYSNKNIYTYR